jgi:hypothetical protein
VIIVAGYRSIARCHAIDPRKTENSRYQSERARRHDYPGTPVQKIARLMADAVVEKVPVIDGIDLLGIVTLTDIVWHRSNIRTGISRTAVTRDRWESASEPSRPATDCVAPSSAGSPAPEHR